MKAEAAQVINNMPQEQNTRSEGTEITLLLATSAQVNMP